MGAGPPARARPDVAVVFPEAGTAGGVERVAAEFLRFESTRRDTAFIGAELAAGVTDADHPVRHVQVAPRTVPAALRPWAFRAAARKAVAATHPVTTVSFGIECPPGDVLWVHSVHAAWVERGTPTELRGVTVPSRARHLLPRHRALLALERAYFHEVGARAVLCTSAQEVEDLAHHYDVPRERMHVVPNGFDPAVFSPARRTALRDAARDHLGAGPDDIVVLLVANEWHRKGLGVLLDAVAALGDPRVRVDLVGRRRPDAYLARARRLGLGARVHWHGGTADVAPYYAAADVFALPTTYEPFGIVVVEALAMGLPAVVSSLAGAASTIRDGVDGLLLDDPRDAGTLHDALARLTDPAQREPMGRAAALAAASLRWDQVLARADAIVFGDVASG